MEVKNENQIINDSDKNIKLSSEEMEMLIAKIKSELLAVVTRNMLGNFCSKKRKRIWKLLKNPIVGRPIVAGYNWILMPASIFVGHYFKEFYSKFDSFLTDSLSLIKILEMHRFN